MANVLLNNVCNLDCPYCFARDKKAARRRDVREMSLEHVGRVIAFLEQSGQNTFRMLGGEPTLHSRFLEILRLALRRMARATVFSNGLWDEEVGRAFRNIPPSHISYLINVNAPGMYSPRQWEMLARNLGDLSGQPNVTLGINIFRPDFDYRYIIELAKECDFHQLRWSLAFPILGERNVSLSLRSDYKDIAPRLVAFTTEAAEAGLNSGNDCGGLVPCMFTSDQLARMMLNRSTRLFFTCTAPVDIGPDLSVWRCFPLANVLSSRLENFDNEYQVQAFYASKLRPYAEVLALPECCDCKYRRWGVCQGGCIAERLAPLAGELVAAQERTRDGSNFEGLVPHLSPRFTVAEYAFDFEARWLDEPMAQALVDRDSLTTEALHPFLAELVSYCDGSRTVGDIAAIFEAKYPTSQARGRGQYLQVMQALFDRGVLFASAGKDEPS